MAPLPLPVSLLSWAVRMPLAMCIELCVFDWKVSLGASLRMGNLNNSTLACLLLSSINQLLLTTWHLSVMIETSTWIPEKNEAWSCRQKKSLVYQSSNCSGYRWSPDQGKCSWSWCWVLVFVTLYLKWKLYLTVNLSPAIKLLKPREFTKWLCHFEVCIHPSVFFNCSKIFSL